MAKQRNVSWLDVAITLVLVCACSVLLGLAYYLNSRLDDAWSYARKMESSVAELQAQADSCQGDLDAREGHLETCQADLGGLTELPTTRARAIQQDARPLSKLSLADISEVLGEIRAFEEVFPEAKEVSGLVRLSHQLMERERVILKSEARDLARAVEEARLAPSLEAVEGVIEDLNRFARTHGGSEEGRAATQQSEQLQSLRRELRSEELIEESRRVVTLDEMKRVHREMEALTEGGGARTEGLADASKKLSARIYHEESASAWEALRLAGEAANWDELAEHLEVVELFRTKYPRSDSARKMTLRLQPIEDRRPWMRVRRLIPENQVAGEVQWQVVKEVAGHLTSEGIDFAKLHDARVGSVYGEAMKDPAAERGLPITVSGVVTDIRRRGEYFTGLLEGPELPPPGRVRFVTTADTRGVVNGTEMEFAGVTVQRNAYKAMDGVAGEALLMVGHFGAPPDQPRARPFRLREAPEAVGAHGMPRGVGGVAR